MDIKVADKIEIFVEAVEKEEELYKLVKDSSFFEKKSNNLQAFNSNGSGQLFVDKKPILLKSPEQEEKLLRSKQKILEKINNKSNQKIKESEYNSVNMSVCRTKTGETFNNYFKNTFKSIQVKAKGISKSMIHFQQLYQIQSFKVDSKTIWVVKISNDNKFIATAGQSGKISIWEIVNNAIEGEVNINLVNEVPYKEFTDHTKDVIELCWSYSDPNLILSASLDNHAILWNITKDNCLFKFDHSSMITCLTLSSCNDDVFATGCADRTIRIFSIKKKKVIDYLNTMDISTSISFCPLGDRFVIGYSNGKCEVFDTSGQKLRLISEFVCKNRFGKYSKGRKVTGLEFLNNNHLLVSTNDSRMRVYSFQQNKVIAKYKGHQNDNNIIKATYEETNDLILSASEDGYVYIWPANITQSNTETQSQYEYIFPFEGDKPIHVLLSNQTLLNTFQKRFFQEKIFFKNLILICSEKGTLQILAETMFLDDN